MSNPGVHVSTHIVPLTAALSQYAILTSVCSVLSSADIIHLAAACKENWTYIASSEPVLGKLMSSACCDGRGIVAQARVFGCWKGDPCKAENECLGKDAKPCSSCHAQVCNNCRFHFSYTAEALASEELERAIAGVVQGDPAPGLTRRDAGIQGAKAFEVSWRRIRSFCNACEPLILGFENEFSMCKCVGLYEDFVGSRWLCLPCFFGEEVEAYNYNPLRTIAYKPDKLSTGGERGYETIITCECGQPALDGSIEACSWCNGIVGYSEVMVEAMLEKIYAQLG